MTSKKVVVVTGFGPFGGFTENPSSQIVELLSKSSAPFGDNVSLTTELLPVAYDDVAERVPQLWQDYQPMLIVHVGVHPHSKRTIYLEQQSFNRGYCRQDIKGDVPRNNVCCKDDKCSISVSGLNCEEIAKKASDQLQNEQLQIAVSHDPGRYLCAFSYFISLHKDKSRSLFVHVPPPDHCTPIELQTEAVTLIIKECLNQLQA